RTWPGRERLYPELAAFLDRVLDRLPDGEVILVPMEGELDRAAAEELVGYLARPRVRVLSVQDDPADLEALVAGSWLAVGMRLHFLLFAARAGVPVLALNYDPKVAGAMARLGMSRYVFELDRVRAADLLAAFDELVARYDEVSGALRRAAAELAAPAAANLDYVDAAAARALGVV
ncbi:MAG TPA: polysaccharide pyruvyl transferase family protein, partial [Thermaerobacter sp.]